MNKDALSFKELRDINSGLERQNLTLLIKNDNMKEGLLRIKQKLVYISISQNAFRSLNTLIDEILEGN